MTGPDSPKPIAQVFGVTLDVHDLEVEKDFWAAALGVGIKSQVSGWVAFHPLSGCIALSLQEVAEDKVAKNRFHFDLRIRSGDDGVRQLQDLGSSILDHVSGEDSEWYVMADPEGNEFCAVTRHIDFAASDASQVRKERPTTK